MILLPAIDILQGKAVRLAGGDFDRQTVYDADPLDAAQRWAQAGAQRLHVVDLDGARHGTPMNLRHVARIAAGVSVPVQVGGGLRSLEAVAAVFEAGADRAILGTAAMREPEVLEQALAQFSDRIVVSVDARRGMVATAGWTEQTTASAVEVLADLGRRGVARCVYSSIERDGMLSGPDLGEVRAVSEVAGGRVIYSGGVSSVADLQALAGLGAAALEGVIVGTALYERRFTVAEGEAALGGPAAPDR